MSAEDNAAIVRRFVDEVHNKRNLDALHELTASNFVYRDAHDTERAEDGLAEYRRMLEAEYTAFPDVSSMIDTMVAEGDTVVTRETMSGTHSGTLTVRGPRLGEVMISPPTGRRINVASVNIMRIADGCIRELWRLRDDFEMIRQLGLLPELRS